MRSWGDTFEDYCKDVEGLAYSTAREKITAYLVHRAIEDNIGDKNLAPSTEAQVRQFFAHDGAIAKFKTAQRETVLEPRTKWDESTTHDEQLSGPSKQRLRAINRAQEIACGNSATKKTPSPPEMR